MLAEAQAATERFAAEERIEVGWDKIWSIEPILFDETLLGFCDEAITEVAGSSHRLPSGHSTTPRRSRAPAFRR